jgi:hypothetical protein
MIKILSFVALLVGLTGCTRTEKEQSAVTVSSGETASLDSAVAVKSTMSDYEASFIYSSSDSDSLLIDIPEVGRIVASFKRQGTLIQNNDFSGGDCESKLRRLVYNRDTLTIEKYSCGDYGFGNSQYLTHDDSLKFVRLYTMKWLAESGEQTEYKVTEKVYTFGTGRVTINERTKMITGWRDFYLVDIPFEKTTSSGQNEYVDLTKEHRELLNYGY